MPSPDRSHAPATALDTSPVGRLALEHYNPKPISKVPLERWRSVFARCGSPPTLTDPATATIEDVVVALTCESMPPHLQDLLQVLHDMGNARGSHVLNESAVTIGLDRDDWPDAVEELAVEVWARARVDARYQRLLLVAEVGFHERIAESSYREFCGRKACRMENPDVHASALRAAITPFFQKEKMGNKVKILLRSEDDRVVFCVFHGTRRQYEATFDDDGSEGMVAFRPLVCDVITYDHFDGRLRITARSRRIAERYREYFGVVFFGDAAFFSERPRYDLGPIAQAIEAGSLPAPPDSSEIHRANLVECLWTIGDGVQHRIRGLNHRDCTQQARRAHFRANEDRLTQVTLGFTFLTAGRLERTDIVLRTGNQFECRKPARRDAIEEYLGRIGVRATGNLAITPPVFDLSLLSVRSAAQWRSLFGDRLAEACDQKILRHANRSFVEPADAPGAVGADPVTQIELDGEQLALAQNEREGDVRLVRADQLTGYALDPRRLAEVLRDELKCEGSLRELPIEGAFDLGPTNVGSVTVRPFLLAAPSAASPRAVLFTLAGIAGPRAKWIVILPPNAPPDEWGMAVALRTLLPPFRVRTDIIRALGLADEVTALERADGVRLVVDTQRHVAWLDEVPLNLPEIQQRLLEVLARAKVAGQSLLAGELAHTLCNDRDDEDVIRQRLKELSKTVRERMHAAGRSSMEYQKVARSPHRGAGYSLLFPTYVE